MKIVRHYFRPFLKCTGGGNRCFKASSLKSKVLEKESESDRDISKIPNLRDFINNSSLGSQISDSLPPVPLLPPYLENAINEIKEKKKVYIETYGCQMNTNDTEIVMAILENSGFQKIKSISDADVILLMTCAIRDGAERRIWNRIHDIRSVILSERGNLKSIRFGLLGCMAERLKETLLSGKGDKPPIHVVCGPDAYRDLPRLLAQIDESRGQRAINVMLSSDETYADIMPLRWDPESCNAYVSIMRGCDNMCSYCIVPFTRGRERSRPFDSIIDECKFLEEKYGIRQITLLGQNVNSYRDVGSLAMLAESPPLEGFKTIYRTKHGGVRFTELLDRVSSACPQVRFRFTSPHPKDFPDDLLHLMQERGNICKQVHMPAQSGSSRVLELMRRGYDRDSYLRLVENIRSIVPNVSLSSDFITGFCGESDEDHKDTLSLLDIVKYDQCFMFAYSLREKTHAHRNYQDNVPEPVKKHRLKEIITRHGEISRQVAKRYLNTIQVMLVHGISDRDPDDLFGSCDSFLPIVCKKGAITSIPMSANGIADDLSIECSPIKAGDWVVVRISETYFQTLLAEPLYKVPIPIKLK